MTENLSQPLAGQVAIVSGAAQGIGKVLAMDLARRGANVMLGDMSAEILPATAQEIRELHGVQVATHLADLSTEQANKDLVAATLSAFGKVDILVNNAGGGVILPFLEHTPETLETTINRNLWTVIWACRAALPSMLKQNYGRIINIGADSVRNGLWDHAAYNAAKGGVHGIITGLAREYAETPLTFNVVAPCAVRTQQVDDIKASMPELYEKYISVIPKGRPAEMQEVAAVVSFLAGAEASFVTGQVISVNGGSTML
ncbi:MAG: SDR family oxidoreductase [Porticoccaceae bacterium]